MLHALCIHVRMSIADEQGYRTNILLKGEDPHDTASLNDHNAFLLQLFWLSLNLKPV